MVIVINLFFNIFRSFAVNMELCDIIRAQGVEEY